MSVLKMPCPVTEGITISKGRPIITTYTIVKR